MGTGLIAVSGAGVGLPNVGDGSGIVPGSPTGTSSVYTFASLPNAASSPVGTIEYTSDQGLVVSNGSIWTNLAGGAINVLNFGADPSGLTDSTAAIAAADAAAFAAKGYVFFPAGTYSIKLPTGGVGGQSILASGASWIGVGRNLSILKSVAGTYLNAQKMIYFLNKSNFQVFGMGFDMSLVTGPTGSVCSFILVYGSTNWAIDNCSFTGISVYMLGVYANGGDKWAIRNSYFYMPSPTGIGANQAINIQVNSGTHTVSQNVCIGTGIFTGSSNGSFIDNLVTGWAYGGGIVLGVPPCNLTGIKVIGNTCVNSGAYGVDVNNTYPDGIECWGQQSLIIGNVCSNNSGAGITASGYGTNVIGNQCVNNGQQQASGCGINIFATQKSGTYGLTITGNVCTDTQVVKTQKYGYGEFGNGVTPLNSTLTGVQITGTAGQISWSSMSYSPLAVGAQILVTGAFGGTGSITGYSSPSIYLVSATNGTSTATLTQINGAALVTTAGTPTGLTYNFAFIQGLLASNNYLIGNATNQTYIQGVAPLLNFSLGGLALSYGSPIPAGGDQSIALTATSTANFGMYFGSGAPTIAAAQGSIYLRSDGSSNVTRAYINNSAGSGTSWTAINTVA